MAAALVITLWTTAAPGSRASSRAAISPDDRGRGYRLAAFVDDEAPVGVAVEG
jgi:hypothetical protein